MRITEVARSQPSFVSAGHPLNPETRAISSRISAHRRLANSPAAASNGDSATSDQKVRAFRRGMLQSDVLVGRGSARG